MSLDVRSAGEYGRLSHAGYAGQATLVVRERVVDKYWNDSSEHIKQLMHAHEHVWVPSRISGMFEECSVLGCTLARYSRPRIERMRQITGSAVNGRGDL